MVEGEHLVHSMPPWVDMNSEDSQCVLVGRLEVHLDRWGLRSKVKGCNYHTTNLNNFVLKLMT